MQIQSLRVFRDLAKVKNITTTARMHKVTQSAVSQMLQSMERQLHTSLGERDQHGCVITAEGELFYAFAKRTLEVLDSAQARIQEVQRILANRITLACVQSIGLYSLPAYMKRFHQERPGMSVHIGYRRTGQVYEDITRNEVDLGLVAFPARSDNYRTVVFRCEPLVLACHPKHPLAKLRLVRFKVLKGVSLAGFEPNSPTRHAIDKLFKNPPLYVVQSDSLEAVKKAVELGLAVAILPAETIRSEIVNRTLAAVQLEHQPSMPLAVVYRKTKVLTPAMKRFIKMLGEPRS